MLGKKGAFICIEGLDGCGKTTQAKLLAKKLRKSHNAVYTAEPSHGTIGTYIRNSYLYGKKRLSSILEALLFAADRIVDPVAIFQGEIDRVVPRDQAETIVAELRRNGVPHEYHLYAGEGHGWRKTETIEAFYTTVLRFLRQYVLFA